MEWLIMWLCLMIPMAIVLGRAIRHGEIGMEQDAPKKDPEQNLWDWWM